MGIAPSNTFVRIGAILLGLAAFATPAASADEHIYRKAAPPGAYAAPITPIYQYLGTHPYEPWTPWDYTFPILATYQFPAVMANQPGSDVGYLRSHPSVGLLGGRAYLYHQ